MAFTMIPVTGSYRAGDGTIPSGEITFTPTVPMRNGVVTVAATVTATISSTGTISVTLAATDDPATVPAGGTYRVLERIYGVEPRIYYLPVPHDAGTVDLDDPATEIVETYPAAIANPGPVGPPGPAGPQGPAGSGGTDGVATAGRAVALTMILGS